MLLRRIVPQVISTIEKIPIVIQMAGAAAENVFATATGGDIMRKSRVRRTDDRFGGNRVGLCC